MDQQHGLLFRGFELPGDICRLLFMIQKSITSRTSNSEYGMDLRRFLRHLEFAGQSVSRCSDAQLKADALSIVFNLQKETMGYIFRDTDKSLARPGRKQATATEDFDFHISYL